MLTALLTLTPAPAPPLKIVVQAGQTANVTVNYPYRSALLNREAPNTIALSTPWGRVEAKPTGTPHPDAKFSAYFGTVNPTHLKWSVPKQVASGSYAANISAQLFVCDAVQKMCSHRAVNVPVTLQVVKAGSPVTTQNLNLNLDEGRLVRRP